MIDSMAVFNALLNHPAAITTVNAASAMSIASLILQAGDSRQAYGNAITMVHDSITGTYGNAGEHRETAEILDKFNRLMGTTYESRGVKKDDIASILDGKDHYYTATEDKNLGLIDEITNHLSIADSSDHPRHIVPDHLSSQPVKAEDSSM